MSSIQPGDFASIPGMHPDDAKLFSDAYQAITITGNWDTMKNFGSEPSETSFMFSSAPFLNEVQKHMKMLDDHSGSSYGCVMRNMEYIAKHSWDSFVQEFK
jgi:hypothetical protein